MSKHERIALIISAILIVAAFAASHFRAATEEQKLKPHLSCVIELGEHPERRRNLIIGYNYALLREYSQSNSQSIDISLSNSDSTLDSLKRGYIDILVVPSQSKITHDSLLVSHPIDSSCVWLMPRSARLQMHKLNSWISQLHHSADFAARREPYMRRFSHQSKRRRTYLSPYDSLIRIQADSLGWDWRMLAAVIYNESHFHIEARSRRGALGLMQMMPSTAEHYGVGDPLDPESNIRGGSQLLRDLSRRYASLAADRNERFKYTLAAYNAGVGRIDDILRLASARGKDISYWDSAKVVIPEMSAEQLDTSLVRCGPFKGVETLAYVEEVLGIYSDFQRICP